MVWKTRIESRKSRDFDAASQTSVPSKPHAIQSDGARDIDWRCEATSRKSEPELDILLERMAIAREIKTIDDQLRALNADLDR